MTENASDDDALMKEKILKALEYKTVAMVGLSTERDRPSYRVAIYLLSKGYEVVPVRPDTDSILGKKAYPRLTDIPFPVDIVDVFRKPEHVVEVAREAVSVGAKVLWMQLGIENPEAQKIAEDAGLMVIADRCMAHEYQLIEDAARGY